MSSASLNVKNARKSHKQKTKLKNHYPDTPLFSQGNDSVLAIDILNNNRILKQDVSLVKLISFVFVHKSTAIYKALQQGSWAYKPQFEFPSYSIRSSKQLFLASLIDFTHIQIIQFRIVSIP